MNQNELIEVPAWVRNHPETLLNRYQQEELKRIVNGQASIVECQIKINIVIDREDLAKAVLVSIGGDDGIERESAE